MVCQIPHPKIENVANDDDMEPYVVNNIVLDSSDNISSEEYEKDQT